MRLGLHLMRYDYPGGSAATAATLAEVGRAVDEAGIDVLSVMDHFMQLPSAGPPDLDMLEGYTTLGFLAAHTTSVELQLMVTGVTYRHPAVLAKIVSTLDVLSAGRAALGIGAGWYELENTSYGLGFPTLRERFERLEETLQIVRLMFGPGQAPYAGRHYRLDSTLNSPRPLHDVPIMVGGAGEKKTLRLVATYADACNINANPELGVDGMRHKLEVLRRHCEHVGRDYDEIRKTIIWAGTMDAGPRFLEELRPYADLGISEVHAVEMSADPVGLARRLGAIRSEIASL